MNLFRLMLFMLPAFCLFVACEKDDITDESELMITVEDSGFLTEELSTGITDLSSEEEPLIYPNPFKTNCYLLIPEYTGRMVKVIISDDTGKFKVIRDSRNQGEETITLKFSKVPAGNYLCDVQIDEMVFRYELLKIE